MWASLGLAFVAVAASVYICIWALAVCVWLLAVGAGMGATAATRQIARLSVLWVRKALSPFLKAKGGAQDDDSPSAMPVDVGDGFVAGQTAPLAPVPAR